MSKVVHYMSPDRVRWRRGKWSVEHGAHSAVCTGGSIAEGTYAAYDRKKVTCKRCLVILPLIDAYVPGDLSPVEKPVEKLVEKSGEKNTNVEVIVDVPADGSTVEGIDVPSIMRAGGFKEGVEAERARLLPLLTALRAARDCEVYAFTQSIHAVWERLAEFEVGFG